MTIVPAKSEMDIRDLCFDSEWLVLGFRCRLTLPKSLISGLGLFCVHRHMIDSEHGKASLEDYFTTARVTTAIDGRR